MTAVPHADKARMSLNACKTTNADVQLSSWTFDDLMAFVGMDEAVAA